MIISHDYINTNHLSPGPDELKLAVQAEVRSNGTLAAHSTARQESITFLREINLEISQLLAMDFASLAKQSNCC